MSEEQSVGLKSGLEALYPLCASFTALSVSITTLAVLMLLGYPCGNSELFCPPRIVRALRLQFLTHFGRHDRGLSPEFAERAVSLRRPQRLLSADLTLACASISVNERCGRLDRRPTLLDGQRVRTHPDDRPPDTLTLALK